MKAADASDEYPVPQLEKSPLANLDRDSAGFYHASKDTKTNGVNSNKKQRKYCATTNVARMSKRSDSRRQTILLGLARQNHVKVRSCRSCHSALRVVLMQLRREIERPIESKTKIYDPIRGSFYISVSLVRVGACGIVTTPRAYRFLRKKTDVNIT